MKSRQNPEKLKAYADQAISHIQRQATSLSTGEYHENRYLGLKVVEGQQSWATISNEHHILVREGELRNRLTGDTQEQHTLQLAYIHSIGAACVPSYARLYTGFADLTSGEARFSYTHTRFISGSIPSTVYGEDAWSNIMPLVQDINAFMTPGLPALVRAPLPPSYS